MFNAQPWTLTADMARDYGKPGMNTTDLNVQHQLEPPKVRSAWIRSEFPEGDRVEILVEAEFAKSLHEMYGAPATAWINYTVGSAITKSITVEISLLNKTATRCKPYWVTLGCCRVTAIVICCAALTLGCLLSSARGDVSEL